MFICFPRRLSFVGAMLSVCLLAAGQQTTQTTGQNAAAIDLMVPAGSPLRLYVTGRVPFRVGASVQAKLAEPVWSFDRIVIPQGTVFRGHVSQLIPESRMLRAMAMVRGDFTPLERAEVGFTSMTLPGGKTISIEAFPSFGLNSFYVPPKPANGKSKPAKSNARWAFVKQQAMNQANTRSHGLLDFVRGPNKREWLEDFCWSKLPYHPQRYRSGTRFDAVLEKPLDFGEVSIPADQLRAVGTTPAPDAAAQVRFLSTISSADSHVGDPVAGVLSEPLFSAKHELVLPEGTHLNGKVTQARPARMFHRGGQLRFAFDKLGISDFAFAPEHNERTEAQLTAAEETNGSLKVDPEGTAKATESKARFLRPVIAGLVAAKTLDNDAGKQQTATGGANGNGGGLGLGGFSGFGLFGTAAAYGPPPVGQVLGFYGLGWSVYQTVISRGHEVRFDKNAVMAIKFGAVKERSLTAKR